MPVCMGMGLCVGGGSKTPLASGDFTDIATSNAVDGVYTLNGAAAVIGDIIDLDHPDTTFNPATDIDAGGIGPRAGPASNGFVINEPLLGTLIADGFTIVMEFMASEAAEAASCVGMQFYSADFNFYADTRTGFGGATGGTSIAPLDGEWDGIGTDPEEIPTELVVNKIVYTFSDTSVVFSLNGRPTVTCPEPCLSDDIEVISMFVGAGSAGRLRKFDFYEPVDEADLPELSAL